MPQRHRSIRATITVSWQRLSEMERDVFAQLSIFRGGFTWEAAQAVTGATPRPLANLVNKSFLQYDPVRDRYLIHELMRQFGAEKLAEDGEAETAAHDRHSSYYCQMLGGKEQELKGPRRRIVLVEIEANLGNIEAAWRWAARQRLWSNLRQACRAFFRFYVASFRYQDSLAVCQWTVNQLAPENITEVQDKDSAWILARALICMADAYLYLNQLQHAELLLQQSQTI